MRIAGSRRLGNDSISSLWKERDACAKALTLLHRSKYGKAIQLSDQGRAKQIRDFDKVQEKSRCAMERETAGPTALSLTQVRARGQLAMRADRYIEPFDGVASVSTDRAAALVGALKWVGGREQFRSAMNTFRVMGSLAARKRDGWRTVVSGRVVGAISKFPHLKMVELARPRLIEANQPE